MQNLQQSEALTPMLRQYLGIKGQYPDAILMFRLGDFYEMFFEDAEIASKILDITLTSRNRNDPNPVPLCGVPYHSVEPYITRLLERGKKVAICDQVEDPKFAKGVVKREVTRVLTPGVIPAGPGLDAASHNFLACAVPHDGRMGMAIADVSTGILQAAEFPSMERLLEEVGRMEPREILLPQVLAQNKQFTTRLSQTLPAIAQTVLSEDGKGQVLFERLEGAQAFSERPAAARAAAGALSYLDATQKGRIDHIKSVSLLAADSAMLLDDATKRNLELVRTISEANRHGSLLDEIDRTSTAPGARKLKYWLLYPLTDPVEISARLDAVEAIVSEPALLRDLPQILARIGDIERITSRAAMGLANARDLEALKESLLATAKLKERLREQSGLLALLGGLVDPHAWLVDEIAKSIADNPPLTLKEGGLIRQGVSAELDEFREIISHGKDYVARLEAAEREATGIGSLKVRYNKVFGYYLEVTNTHRDKVPEHYIRKQTLTNAERFITPELKGYEEKILSANERARELEYEIFKGIEGKVGSASAGLLATADALASVDALVSAARIAAEYDYCRPVVDETQVIDIREGRHPIVERANPQGRFVPNDVYMDDADNRLLMITGPNMAGKSTVMRQTALITLLAQMGSFVPASSARIGVVDRIFTRVGASDALAQGKSTFMVEMSETAMILSEATDRSLVIIDEVGRGTSTFDGLAIAWAIAEDLHDRVRARTMFATHYHELTELALTKGGIRNMQIAVREWMGEVIFLRRLIPGATPRSYGIQVARLAGLPQGVIERAGEVLANLESGELDEAGKPRLSHSHCIPTEGHPVQYQLFSQPPGNEIAKRLAELDTHSITPIEAINILHELKSKCSK